MPKKYAAEALGAFLLTLVVGLSLAAHFPVVTPILAGLTLGLFVYAAGSISGAHINPAVTIGVWSLKKISTKDAVWYIVCQFVGAYIAALVIKSYITPAVLVAGDATVVGMAEFLGAVFFTFGIAAVVYGKVHNAASGLVVGGSLLLGIAIASVASNGVLNPAVAMGVGSFSWMYLLGPIVGALVGMNLYRWLIGEKRVKQV